MSPMGLTRSSPRLAVGAVGVGDGGVGAVGPEGPLVERAHEAAVVDAAAPEERGLWRRLGDGISRNPRPVWISTVAALAEPRVARGAAYYGLVRRGVGVRISAGLARTYYIGAETGASTAPQAVCLAPAGIEEGGASLLEVLRRHLLLAGQQHVRWSIEEDDDPRLWIQTAQEPEMQSLRETPGGAGGGRPEVEQEMSVVDDHPPGHLVSPGNQLSERFFCDSIHESGRSEQLAALDFATLQLM